MYKIVWSSIAKTDYWKNIDYLLKDWTNKEVVGFIEEVEAVIKIISAKPRTFRESDYKNIRQVPITPQITLFYRVNNKTIELVRFWNNYQNPEQFKI